MPLASNNINKLTDHLFRHEAGKMVSVLTRIFGLYNLELAEDVVQDTFAKALKEWIYQMPDNPSAWLMQTAKNRAIDLIRQNRNHKEIAKEISPLMKSEYTVVPAIEKLFIEYEIRDSQLRMIFACSHPRLSETDRIALTLKTCSGFGLDEIARALLTNSETIKKRLQRAKQLISEQNLRFEIPLGKELKNRLDDVMNVLYLIFNEGYNSSSKEGLIRKDLCLEALRLGLLLTEHDYTKNSKCYSLVALMTLLASRFDARIDEGGEIVLLEDQDRSKWNKKLINIGLEYLTKSSEGDDVSEYHIQAAIVAEHSVASNIRQTNWELILKMYDTLLQINNSPLVQLNRAIVISKISGAQKAIDEIQAIEGLEKLLQTQYLFPATLGELYKNLKQYANAREYLSNAITLTDSPAEKKLLSKKLESLN